MSDLNVAGTLSNTTYNTPAMATSQRFVNMALAGSLGVVALNLANTFVLGSGALGTLLAFAGLGAAGFAAFSTFKLFQSFNKSTGMSALGAVGALLPLVGLFVMGVMSSKASNHLRSQGLNPGLLGVNPAELTAWNNANASTPNTSQQNNQDRLAA